jgi:polysaccharide export outer membrane protein
VLAALSLVPLSAQESEPAQYPSSATDADRYGPIVSNLSFEPLGPGDLVYVAVGNCQEISRSYRVSLSGTLTLPLLKEPIQVSGKLPSEIDKDVERQLRDQKILVDPVVSVAVMEYRSRLVNVVGAVKLPTSFQALGNTRLLDAISKAQGLGPDAGPEILVLRKGELEPLHIQAKALMSSGDPALNVELHGGEEVRVPEAPKIYVMGNVKTPGIYPMNDPDGCTVLKALALSQGLLPYSQKTAYVYRVVPGAPKRQQILVAVNDILKKHTDDFQLQANDILYVPDSSFKRNGANVLDRISGFGSSIGVESVVFGHL